MINKIKKMIRKNQAEAAALMTGKMPGFVYGIKRFKDIPVFCFHSAQYPLFERQMQFLSANKFNTLDADELYERTIDKSHVNNGRDIAITFDDGMASVWTVAYPLLKKYEHKIISFILPGFIEEGESVGKTIDDAVDRHEAEQLAARDYGKNSLCNWREIKTMHDSGFIDFQSHGMNHVLINTSDRIVDFIHPGFDVHHYGNIHVPVYDDGHGNFVRRAVLGHPVYEHAPRLSAPPRYLDERYLDDMSIRTKCEEYVAEHGGETFFDQHDWRSEMNNYTKLLLDEAGVAEYESADQVDKAIKEEVVDSKIIIDSKLNKEVKYFCYPWSVSSNKSAQVLQDAGYLSAHVGATTGFRCTQEGGDLVFIKRVQEEYLMALPGEGKSSLVRVFANKIRH